MPQFPKLTEPCPVDVHLDHEPMHFEDFPSEDSIHVPSFADRWLLGLRYAALVCGDGPLRREREDN